MIQLKIIHFFGVSVLSNTAMRLHLMLSRPNSIRPVVLIFIAFLFLPSTSLAHDAGTFSILLRENGPTPNSPQLMINDLVQWYNVDESENITHRVVFDFDGDGLFNGSNEWDSGQLNVNCEVDENGFKTDSNCSVSFVYNFTEPGVYNYRDILSNGTIINATIHVMSDSHVDGNNLENHSAGEGGEIDSKEESTDDEGLISSVYRGKILWFAGISASLVILVQLLLTQISRTNQQSKKAE